MLRLTGIGKTYGLRPVLKDVNARVEKGEIFVLFGHNGAGKTTLLKIAAGIMPPTKGKVEFPGNQDDRSGIFYLGHRNSLYGELTVLENIRFFLDIRNGKERTTNLSETLTDFGLWQRRNDPVKALSQGMKRRLALMKGLISGAGLFILDEPFSGLDIRWKDTLIERFMEIRKNGGSLLIATHLVHEGCRIADRIGLLESGALAFLEERERAAEAIIQERLKNEICR
jgi:heme ABC exporter ATP-binding subunit CcmA